MLLTLAGLAVLGSIPFAIRGSRLSLIPDIPDPFADLPQVEILPEPPSDDPVVNRFLASVESLDDRREWPGTESSDGVDYDAFFADRDYAREHGLAGASPRFVRYIDRQRKLIPLWFDALDRIAEWEPSTAPDFSAIPADKSEWFDVLWIMAVDHAKADRPMQGCSLLLTAYRKLDRIGSPTYYAWERLLRYRRGLIYWLTRLSAQPDLDGTSLAELLKEVRELHPASPETRLKLLHLRFLEDMDLLTLDDPRSYYFCPSVDVVCASRLSIPNPSGPFAAFILAEPDISQRIVRQIYAQARPHIDKKGIARLVRRNLEFKADFVSPDVTWIAGTSSLPVSDRDLENAINHSPLIQNRGCDGVGVLINELVYENQAIHQLHVAIACQLYLRQHGSLPKSLTDLVPEYLPAIPEDPATEAGPHMLYRNDGRLAAVYSRGWNGRDDGGFSGVRGDGDWHGDDRGILIRDLVNHPEQAEGSEKVK